jgi:hypothetical protein
MSVRSVIRMLAGSAALAFAVATSGASAQDVYATAKRDIIVAQDFRVRVSAALLLGKSHDPTARGPLERALSDQHPAVRTAAAAGLGALGEKDAIVALERQMQSDASESVKSQIKSSLERLKGPAAPSLAGVQYVVQIGTMKNSTPIRGEALAAVLRQATKSKAGALPKVAVAEASDAAVLKQALEKKVPILALDGTVLKIAQGRSGQLVTFQAQVEFTLRRVSDQTLKGLLTGSATAMDSVRALGNQQRLSELQDQAIEAAVESALKGADKSMALALR